MAPVDSSLKASTVQIRAIDSSTRKIGIMNLSTKALPVLILVTLLAPQVVVTVFAVVFFIGMIMSLDSMCSRLREHVVEVVRERGPLRLPTNFCTLGAVVALVCALAGFVWGVGPVQGLSVPLQFVLLGLSVMAHMLCLGVFLACIAALNKLVDPLV